MKKEKIISHEDFVSAVSAGNISFVIKRKESFAKLYFTKAQRKIRRFFQVMLAIQIIAIPLICIISGNWILITGIVGLFAAKLFIDVSMRTSAPLRNLLKLSFQWMLFVGLSIFLFGILHPFTFILISTVYYYFCNGIIQIMFLNPIGYIIEGDAGQYDYARDNNIIQTFVISQGNTSSGEKNDAVFLLQTDSNKFLESGKVKAKLKNFQGAIQDFDKAIELEPETPYAYIERGKVRSELKDDVGADQDTSEGNRLLARLDEGLKAFKAGSESYDLDHYQEAIENYSKALAYSSPHVAHEIYYNRGLAKGLLSDNAGAIEDFTKCIQLESIYKADAYFQRGKIKSHKLNSQREALQDYNKAFELNPTNIMVLFETGVANSFLGEFEESERFFSKVIEVAPSDFEAYYERGITRKKLGKENESKKDIAFAIKLGYKEEFYGSMPYHQTH